ncbi:MAG: HD domain-containing protein [Patescibacteria group bacterium]
MIKRYSKVSELVKTAYTSSKEDFAQWIWANHLPLVANKAEELSQKYDANPDIAVAAAWLHDFGDAFTNRHTDKHEELSKNEAVKVLQKCNYTAKEIFYITEEVIGPHSCKDGYLPNTVEGKILATADSLAHLNSDLYVQFAWKHLPENKNYQEYLIWVAEKLERDFHIKIFFEEERIAAQYRYESLKEVFVVSR